MIRSLFASFWLLGAAAHAAEEPVDKATKKPNIICIADNLGYGDVACLNPQGKIATPNIDRLAASGISFKTAAAGPEKPDEFFTPEADKGGLKKVAADPSLPSVLILGDSISIGYTLRVRQALQGKANVLRPKDNCGDTGMGLKSLNRWLGETRWSVIHFNWGLWDLCYRDPQSREQGHRDKVKGKLSTSLEDYEKNLETLVQRLEKTGAVLIWASTTVVPEGEVGRVVGDELKYNEVAARVMKKHGIRSDDLHALTKSFAPGLFTKPGDVHYKAEGYDKLAAQVAAQIAAALPEKKAADKR